MNEQENRMQNVKQLAGYLVLFVADHGNFLLIIQF